MLGSQRTFLRSAPFPRPFQSRLRWWQRTAIRWARLLPLAWIVGIAGWGVILCGAVAMGICVVESHSELAMATNVTLAGGFGGFATLGVALAQRRQGGPKAAAAMQLGLWQLAALLLVVALVGVLTYPGT